MEIHTTPEMGRHVLASRDIPIGEVIAVESPYTTVLLWEKTLDHCHNCLKLCYNLLPCNGCVDAMFCGESCRREAWKLYHKYECGVLSILRKLECTKLERAALRIAITATSINVSELASSKTYHSARYQEIHQLIANTDKRNVADLFERATTAAVIYELLQTSTSFFQDLDMEQYKDVFCELLLLHMQTGPSNFHEISELVACGDGSDYEVEEVGAGAYAFLSLLNHSCSPNVVRCCHGVAIVLRTLRPVGKGEQLFDNYGYVS